MQDKKKLGFQENAFLFINSPKNNIRHIFENNIIAILISKLIRSKAKRKETTILKELCS